MEENEITQLEELLKINTLDLDQALIEQPEAFYRISQAYTQAVSIRDQAHENCKRVDAEVDLAIRDHLAQQGLKTTEKVIDSEVKTNDDHIEAYREYLEAKTTAEKLQALKESFIQRSYMLRELCGLHISGYSVADSSVRSTDGLVRDRIERKTEILKERMKN
jgi:hypothetical protein